MSRYLEMSVNGEIPKVGERALRAFGRIGKVSAYDLSIPEIEGVIKIDGEPAEVRVSFKPWSNGRTRIEMAANSNDVLSRAADGALYAFARAYKSAGWLNSEEDRQERRQRALRITMITAGVLLLLTLIYLLLRASNYIPSR
jgi:hypothetical protein